MTKYDEARKVAEKLLQLERTRKNAQDELKALKEELLNLVTENNIENMFEFDDGLVYLDTVKSYKIADGLKEETKVASKSPEKLSQDFLDTYLVPDLKLSKRAKQAIKDEDDDELLSVLVPEEKNKIKIALRK